ncbi:MAG: DsbE family thiol:disulfide interchange protein [Alphaproteobacteria bacterium]|nr:DsbE family thiol:disulfide interchange protein [Alphaproteobacteria bacterium]
MRWRTVLPLVLFAVLAVALGVGLTLNPRDIPSALIDKQVPDFALPPVPGKALGLASADLKNGEVALVNVFASWCVACRAEHPLLMELARRRTVPLHGLAYKDAPADSARWLAEWGDPYERTGVDRVGRVGIDFGVYGVPETFVVDGQGRIVFKHIGPITPRDLESKILPAIATARGS